MQFGLQVFKNCLYEGQKLFTDVFWLTFVLSWQTDFPAMQVEILRSKYKIYN